MQISIVSWPAICIASRRQRILWLTGGPFTGKSAFLAWLAHTNPEVAVRHFCNSAHAEKSDPRRFVISIAYKLVRCVPDYGEQLDELLLQELVQGSKANSLFDALLVKALGAVPEPQHTIVLIVEALDEASHQGRNALAEILASQFLNTPPRLRLVVRSRPDFEISQWLAKCAYTVELPAD
jgi:hypothetical protein